MRLKFYLVKQEIPPTSKPYRLLETVETSDGPRTRVVDGMWVTWEEAETEMTKREEALRALD